MIDILWDMFQQNQIKNLTVETELQRSRSISQDVKADTLSKRLSDLEIEHEQLKLLTLALWAMLRDKHALSEAELRRYVESIDLLDGKQDGKLSSSREKVTCSGCQRSVLRTARRCVYCGTALPKSGIFGRP